MRGMRRLLLLCQEFPYALAARCSQGFSLIARSVHRFVARREGPCVCRTRTDGIDAYIAMFQLDRPGTGE
jgi:hypothetical protein